MIGVFWMGGSELKLHPVLLLPLFGCAQSGSTVVPNEAGPPPVLAANAAVPEKVVAGDAHTCVLYGNGQVRCWGANGSGQLGTGDTTDRSSPTVANIGPAIDLFAQGSSTCAELTDHTLNCWGASSFTPGSSDVATGSGFVCTLSTSSFEITCTGSLSSPTGIFTQVSAIPSSAHVCALVQDASVDCWGSNSVGQLGNGSVGGSQAAAQPVVGVTSAAGVAAGGLHSCAILTTGNAVVCWGSDSHGQLGDGGSVDSGTPVSVRGL
jgi:alpha-tubulin suppressor-like RCC1 family protein